MANAVVENKAPADVSRAEQTRNVRHYRPNVDIIERPDELLVVADVPGAAAEAIDVNFENGVLTLHARVQPRQDSEVDFLLREYGTGDFVRTFQVSEHIDASRIHAEVADGVLTLHLPKVEAVKPRTIKVNRG
jgi:HSP20 family molecular chaperone IbpA